MKILNFTFLLSLLMLLILFQNNGYAGGATGMNYGTISKQAPTVRQAAPQAVVCPAGFTSNGFQCVRNSTLSDALSADVSASSSGSARTVKKSPAKSAPKKSSESSKAKKDDGTYVKSREEKACEDKGGTWNGECEGGTAQENVSNECLDAKDPSCSKAPADTKEETQAVSSIPAGCTILSESTYNSFPPEQQKNINIYARGPEAGELTICPPAESSGTKDSACKQQFQQLVSQCQQENTSAIDACNQENQSMQQAANAVKVVGAGSVASVKLACSKLGEISKIANGALAAFQGVCATFQGGCEKACSQAQTILNSDCFTDPEKSQLQVTYANDLKGKTDQCIAFKKEIQEAAQHALAAVAQQQAAKQCEEDTSLTTNNVNDCTKNPTSQYCVDKQKCSDPTYAAKNQVCSCYADPTGSACLTAMNKSNSSGTSGGGSMPGVKTSGGTIPGVIGGTDSNENGGYASQGLGVGGGGGDGQGIGGKQGDASSAGKGAGGSTGGGAQGTSASHGAGAGKDSLKVNSGNYGGTPGGSFGAGYFGKTSSGGGTNGAIPPTTGRRDIAKFDPRKYITGLGGKAEYINMSYENIFKIVKMRYEGKKSTLLPEDYNLKK